jgi:hypothetical protein
MSIGDWASTLPRALTVASSLFWSAMLDWIPEARAITAGEQVVFVVVDGVVVEGDGAGRAVVKVVRVVRVRSGRRARMCISKVEGESVQRDDRMKKECVANEYHERTG